MDSSKPLHLINRFMYFVPPLPGRNSFIRLLPCPFTYTEVSWRIQKWGKPSDLEPCALEEEELGGSFKIMLLFFCDIFSVVIFE